MEDMVIAQPPWGGGAGWVGSVPRWPPTALAGAVGSKGPFCRDKHGWLGWAGPWHLKSLAL